MGSALDSIMADFIHLDEATLQSDPMATVEVVEGDEVP